MTIQTEALEEFESEFSPTVTELVARTVFSIPLIGHAQRALTEAGHTAKISGQRITVDEAVEARIVSANGSSWWEVHAIDGSPPVFVVGAQVAIPDWVGAE